ncbi:MAG TPA: M1 family aminopeptidase [Sphingomonas sp.]
MFLPAIVLAMSSVSVPAIAAATADPVPHGILPDAATPTAYRLDLTVLPDQPRFSGHVEIDVTVKASAKTLYLHGRDLKVALARARIGGTMVPATYTQVDPLGVVRLDFATPLPAGKATLVFDYDAPFGEGPSGLYHIKVGDTWYAWTQFESIDARAAYPSFDQPGYKTPFAVTLTTTPGYTAISNAPETGTETVGALEKHVFAPTKPLPTYLVAMMVGPFVTAKGEAAPTPERAAPMPVRIVATRPNADKLDFALRNTGPIVGLLETYFGRPFPFPKLDQIASPVMGGAMENAGADAYDDSLLMLDAGASTQDKREFGMVVSHELSHQWFGDMVTPAWWDDIWLNESFANWMGYRIGNEWRPDLRIGVGAIAEAFSAMNTDALRAGRPIHQPIATSGEIDDAFDTITYGKGGQVVAMIAAYMGDDKFRDGVRLHLNRHAYGNATSEDFFGALADADHDPRLLDAMKSFVNQQGVPLVTVTRTAAGLSFSQKPYAMLGTPPAATRWTIPLCYRIGATRSCALLDKTAIRVPANSGGGVIMPNAGGTGYYRFALPQADWKTLIAGMPALPPGEALAATDSLWAGFRGGDVPASMLVAAARSMADNGYSGAVVDAGSRLRGLRLRGFVPEASLPGYRKLVDAIYAPKLAALGFDPKAGAYAAEDPDRQKLRGDIVGLLAGEADDATLRETLDTAATAYLGGDKGALDQSLLDVALAVHVGKNRVAGAQALFEKGVTSADSQFRGAALHAIGGTGDPATAQWLIGKLDDKRLRSTEQVSLIFQLMSEPATRDAGYDYLLRNFDTLITKAGIFTISGLLSAPTYFCSADKALGIEAALRPKVVTFKRGALTLDRTVESVRDCGALSQAKGAEMAAALAE